MASSVLETSVGCADVDRTVLGLASRQHGVVARWQLLRAGVPRHAVEHRLKRGRLRAVHRGVYRSGPVRAPLYREAAAVLACGDRAVLSHRTAAALWGLVPVQPPDEPVDVTGPRSLRGPRSGVRLHRTHGLDPDEVARKDGLPVTTPGRTLLDLASCSQPRELERALALAERRRRVSREGLDELLARHPRRPGRNALREMLAATGGPALTRSEAESRFLALTRKGSLPRPATNIMVEGIEVDFLWRARRLVVEIDGYTYHGDRHAFENDRRRDGILMAAGYRVVRLTWRQLVQEPEAVLVRVAQALAWSSQPSKGSGPGGPRRAP
jgi:very-short-patch-repair endonuclease